MTIMLDAKRITLIMVFFIFCPFFSLAQSASKITGTLKDSKTKLSLIGANIVLKSKADIVAGTVSDLQGVFVFRNINAGTYQLMVTYIGYQMDSLTLTVNNTDIILKTIFLGEAPKLLKTAEIVSVQTRMEIKGDTAQYNAGAYKTNPDATAEDLVKKLPGVTSDGSTVKVNGEEVKKVLVDGKPFFSDDPTATLRNLPADIVDNVQMFDFQSEQSQFTGFRDGNEEKTINLNTKKGQNVGQFGKIFGGYGADDKYNAGLTFNSFNGAQRISVIGMSNNINQQNFSISDIMSVMSNSGSQGGGPPGPGSAASNFFNGQQNGITKTNAFGINYNDRWGKKITVSGNYFYNNSVNATNAVISRNYFTQDNLQYNQNSISQNNNTNHKFYLKFEYVIDSLNKLTITPRLILQNNKSSSTLYGINTLPQLVQLVSKTSNNSQSDAHGYNFTDDILLQHKFRKKGRTFSFNLNTQANNRLSDGSYYSSSVYEDTLNTNSIIDRKYNYSSNNLTLGGNFVYTEPISNKMQIMVNYRPTYNKNVSDKETLRIDPNGEYSITDTLLSNTYNSDYISNRGGVNFGLNSVKANFVVGSDIEQIKLNGSQTYPDELAVGKVFFNILPSVLYNYKFSKTFNFNLNFRTSSKCPEISQLQNNIDVSNSLFLKTGNPFLKQTSENRLTLRLMKRMPEKESHFIVFLMASQNSNYISNATYLINSDTVVQNLPLSRGSQLIVPVNLNNYFNVRSFAAFGLPFNIIKSNLNIHMGYNFTHTPALINSKLNYAINNVLNAGMYLSSNISQALDFSLAYNGSYNMVSNSLQKQSDNKYFNHTGTFKTNIIFFKRIVLNTDISQTYYVGLSEAYNKSFTLWNAALGYKLLKNQALEIKLSVSDILNQNTNISHMVTETYIEDSKTQMLNRYALFSLTYTFKHFKNGATGPAEMKFPKGMPPPGSMPPGGMPPPGDMPPPR